jgi:glycosyltransferase involved in cell wall biosynthesis
MIEEPLRRTKIISFLSEVKRKNITQIEVINELGMHIDYFVTEGLVNSQVIVGRSNSVIPLSNNFFKRLRQVYNYFSKNKNYVNHIELFGGGRFGFVYALIAKIFGFKILLIERGAMNEFIKKKNRFSLLRFSSYVQYKLADICWYKEYYMLQYLEKLKVKNLNFIPNSIGHHDFKEKTGFLDNKVDYLWVNRVIPDRHIDWVITLARKKEFANSNFAIYGFLNDQFSIQKRKEIQKMRLKNVQLFGYVDDLSAVYLSAKYFLLPANIVFGNNSLFEAMAYGLVPIITDVHGSGHLIKNEINGLISENQFDSFDKSVTQTLSFSEEKWEYLSESAISTVRKKYSLNSFKESLRILYKKIESL